MDRLFCFVFFCNVFVLARGCPLSQWWRSRSNFPGRAHISRLSSLRSLSSLFSSLFLSLFSLSFLSSFTHVYTRLPTSLLLRSPSLRQVGFLFLKTTSVCMHTLLLCSLFASCQCLFVSSIAFPISLSEPLLAKAP